MKLILEQNTDSYYYVEDGYELLTVVTNTNPGRLSCLLSQVIQGEQYPQIEYRGLPYQGSGILYTPDKCVVHTNIPEGFYYGFIRPKPLYFRYQNNNLYFYNSFSEIQAEIWTTPLELVKLANEEKNALKNLSLEKEWIRRKIFEKTIILLCLFLSIATVVYPSIKRDKRLQNKSAIQIFQVVSTNIQQ